MRRELNISPPLPDFDPARLGCQPGTTSQGKWTKWCNDKYLQLIMNLSQSTSKVSIAIDFDCSGAHARNKDGDNRKGRSGDQQSRHHAEAGVRSLQLGRAEVSRKCGGRTQKTTHTAH